jgi:hypothetical protein
MAAISAEQRTERTRLSDRLSAEYAGYDVTMEMLAPDIGDNLMVVRLRFDHVTYDHTDDMLVVDRNPQGVALKVADESGTTTLVSLLRPRDGAQGS